MNAWAGAGSSSERVSRCAPEACGKIQSSKQGGSKVQEGERMEGGGGAAKVEGRRLSPRGVWAEHFERGNEYICVMSDGVNKSNDVYVYTQTPAAAPLPSTPKNDPACYCPSRPSLSKGI
jgi:hypothetical protein